MTRFLNGLVAECSVSDEVLSVGIPEFCRLTGLGRTTAFYLIRSGAVESVRVGRRRLIKFDSIQALLNSDTAEAR